MKFVQDAEDDMIKDVVQAHSTSSYVKRKVRQMEFRFSSSLSQEEIDQAIKLAIDPYWDVWEDIERKVSLRVWNTHCDWMPI